MPINRKGKHWCDPAAEIPSPETHMWTCPECETQWKFWPELNTWAKASEDLTPMIESINAEPLEGEQ